MLDDASSGFSHCYLPLHFWLDKGLVTRHVKKYPMVLRAAWLPRQIRNASGNGGGVLLGYMPIVRSTHIHLIFLTVSPDFGPIRSIEPVSISEGRVLAVQE